MNIPKLPNVRSFMSVGKAFTMAHRPELLFGASIASTIGAVITAAHAGYKSGQQVLLTELNYDAENDPVITERTRLDVKEKIQLTWLNYLPAVGLTGAALGSTTGLHLVHVKEKKAIAAAALMAIDEIKNEANDYKEKVLGIVNDDKKSPAEKDAEIEAIQEEGWLSGDVVMRDGRYWCYDDLANRPIKSTRDHIRRAAEVLITEAMKTGKADLNLFYDEIDLSPSQLGSQMGWTKEDLKGYGGKKGMDLVQFGLTDLPDGSAGVAFWFREPPTSDFQERAAS